MILALKLQVEIMKYVSRLNKITLDYRFAIFARVFDMQKQSCGRKYVSDESEAVIHNKKFLYL